MRRPFYGWVIVAVSFLIGFTESGVFQNILSIFMKPMVDESGWTRASVTGAIDFGSICGGLLSLVVGPIFAGLCFDLLGSYAFPYYSFVAVFFLTGIITLRVRPPRHLSRASERR